MLRLSRAHGARPRPVSAARCRARRAVPRRRRASRCLPRGGGPSRRWGSAAFVRRAAPRSKGGSPSGPARVPASGGWGRSPTRRRCCGAPRAILASLGLVDPPCASQLAAVDAARVRPSAGVRARYRRLQRDAPPHGFPILTACGEARRARTRRRSSSRATNGGAPPQGRREAREGVLGAGTVGAW